MSYFSIKCLGPNIQKWFLLAINILIGIWGTVHLGYAGSFSVVKTKSLEYLALLPVTTANTFQMRQAAVLADGPLAYFVITGVVALAVSCFLILVVLEVIGKENRVFYFRLIALLLITNLLLEFGAAVYSATMLGLYGLLFETQLDMSQDSIDMQPLQSVKDYLNGVRSFYRMGQAEAIVMWIFVIPLTVIMILALFVEFFKNGEPE